jgi:hypothetical protein
MSNSRALLAMQKFMRVCALEITGFLAAGGTDPFLKTVAIDAYDMGATVHWGQRNELTMKQVEKTYDWLPPIGRLYLWRKALGKLSRNGRFPTFSTQFTRIKGLEIVEPQIQGFAAKPTEACTGAPTQITWVAGDNPPGTSIQLEVLEPNSSTPVNIIPLATLDGSQSVAMPLGRKVLKLVAARTLNGRTLTHSQTIDVQGFQDHDTWQFEFYGECRPIDGISRWAAEITFGSYTDPTLRVEEVYCYFSAATNWAIRRVGIPDLLYSPTSTVQPLPTHPKLTEQSWLFFITAPASCGGAPPKINIQFKLVCS